MSPKLSGDIPVQKFVFPSLPSLVALCRAIRVERPQMWERVQVGFGSTGKKRKGPCTKQCAWQKHGSCDTHLAEACPPKFWNTVKHRVEKMRPKWQGARGNRLRVGVLVLKTLWRVGVCVSALLRFRGSKSGAPRRIWDLLHQQQPRPEKPGQSASGSEKGVFWKRGLFRKVPFSRDSREFRDSRDFREPLDWGKQRRIRPFSRDSREFRDFRDSRDSSSEKTPFVMTPFSGPDSICRFKFGGLLSTSPRATTRSQTDICWVLFRPTFLPVRNSCVFVLAWSA